MSASRSPCLGLPDRPGEPRPAAGARPSSPPRRAGAIQRRRPPRRDPGSTIGGPDARRPMLGPRSCRARRPTPGRLEMEGVDVDCAAFARPAVRPAGRVGQEVHQARRDAGPAVQGADEVRRDVPAAERRLPAGSVSHLRDAADQGSGALERAHPRLGDLPLRARRLDAARPQALRLRRAPGRRRARRPTRRPSPRAAACSSSTRPTHTRLRALVSRAFTPRAIANLEPHIEQIVDEALSQVPENEPFDLMERLAHPLPITIIAEMIGVPPEDRHRFQDWSERVARILEPTITPAEMQAALVAAAELSDYFPRDHRAASRGPAGRHDHAPHRRRGGGREALDGRDALDAALAARRRQRDNHQPDRQRHAGPAAPPRSAAPAAGEPRPRGGRRGGAAALRRAGADRRPHGPGGHGDRGQAAQARPAA